jgi:hypothetical protein
MGVAPNAIELQAILGLLPVGSRRTSTCRSVNCCGLQRPKIPRFEIESIPAHPPQAGPAPTSRPMNYVLATETARVGDGERGSGGGILLLAEVHVAVADVVVLGAHDTST